MSKRDNHSTIPSHVHHKVLAAILLTAMGIMLFHYRFPYVLANLGFPKKNQEETKGAVQQPVLRGTIYDRKFRELAVSYQLFNLRVEPAVLADLGETAAKLADVLPDEPTNIVNKLLTAATTIELADYLDQNQEMAIREMNIEGISCSPVEIRFYPEHTTAAHILGFTEHDLGLAGVEGLYDLILQPRKFSARDLPELSFPDQKILGATAADLQLTIDLTLQKELERAVKVHMQQNQVDQAMALVLDPQTGGIQAMATLPTFNPNYFWKVDETTRNNGLICTPLALELIEPLLLRAADAAKNDSFDETLPPPAGVAAPGLGLTKAELDTFSETIGLREPVLPGLFSCTDADSLFSLQEAKESSTEYLSGLQLALAVASLINGGWRVPIHLLQSIHDRATDNCLPRSADYDQTTKYRLVPPATGVKIRRALTRMAAGANDEYASFTSASFRLEQMGSRSIYVSQQLFLGWSPQTLPRSMVLIATQRTHLRPDVPATEPSDSALLSNLFREMLPLIQATSREVINDDYPTKPNTNNYNRLLVSRRLDVPHQFSADQESPSEFLMPELAGLSLRQGLQKLSRHNLSIQINGSGRIISQEPKPGAELNGGEDCVLTLQ